MVAFCMLFPIRGCGGVFFFGGEGALVFSNALLRRITVVNESHYCDKIIKSCSNVCRQGSLVPHAPSLQLGKAGLWSHGWVVVLYSWKMAD